jgi:RimJ/RimL family protein N-acetyltransferase
LTDGVVALREWRLSDVPAVVAACQDPEIPRWTLVPSPYTEADGREFIERKLSGEAGELGLAIVDAASDELLGAIGLCFPRAGTGGIGYWIAAAARGRGVATRAVRLMCDWGFRELGLARIDLEAEPENEASWRVAERAGFTREGLLRSWLELKGRRRDYYIYSLLPGELDP